LPLLSVSVFSSVVVVVIFVVVSVAGVGVAGVDVDDVGAHDDVIVEGGARYFVGFFLLVFVV
jgi:hypothetical protein